MKILIGSRFYSLAATLQGRIVGIIVAETKELGQVGISHFHWLSIFCSIQLAKEDRTILANCFRRGTKVFNSSSFTLFSIGSFCFYRWHTS